MSSPNSSTPALAAGRLISFLQSGGHSLLPSDAETACANLPPDPKVAAKELRKRLALANISLKHTHALKAIADIRQAPGVLGLGAAGAWDAACWVADAPAVEATMRKAVSFAEAADLVCERLRENCNEAGPPLVRVLRWPSHLELVMVGQPVPSWRAVIASSADSPSSAMLTDAVVHRLIGRLLRIIEGAHHGWLDGASTGGNPLQPMFRFVQSEAGQLAYATEAEFAAAWCGQLGITAEDPEAVLAHLSKTGVGVRDQAEWRQGSDSWGPVPSATLLEIARRYLAFVRHNDGDLPFGAWLAQQRDDEATFAPEALNVRYVQARCGELGISVGELDSALRIPPGTMEHMLSGGHAPLALFAPLAQALQLANADSLLGSPQQPRPFIPLASADDAATFMSRFPLLAVHPSLRLDAGPAAAAVLEALCGRPFAERKAWSKQVPAPLAQALAELERAGRVLCARPSKRFVQDLPMGRDRLAIALELSVHSQHVVESQAAADVPTEAWDGERITDVWLVRLNAPRFDGDDLQRYSNRVAEMRSPEDDEKSAFEVRTIAAIQVFARDPNRAHAASERMEALARLMARINLDPWVSQSSDTGAVMLSKPVFEAAARCPLVDVGNGRLGFESVQFQRLIVQFA